jgi:hypothetical protein
VQRIKFKQLDHWQYQYLDTVLELLTGTKKNCKTRPENEETTNHSWTASSKGRCRSLVCFQKTGRKGSDAVRSSPCNRNCKTSGICRQEGPLIQVVRTHQHNTDSTVLRTARCLKTEVQRETRKIKGSIEEKTKGRWQGRSKHGQLPRNLDEKLVDTEQSYRWIKSVDNKGETESTIV